MAAARFLIKTGIDDNNPNNPVLKAVVNQHLALVGLKEVEDGGDLAIQAYVLTESVPQLEAVLFGEGYAFDYGTVVASMGRYNRQGTLYLNLIDQPCGTPPLCQCRKKINGGVVGPMDVFQHQDQRVGLRNILQQLADLAQHSARRCAEDVVAKPDQFVRHKMNRQLESPRWRIASDRRGKAVQLQLAQSLKNRIVRFLPSVEANALASQQMLAVALNLADKRLDQRGLPHPRVTGDTNRLTGALLRSGEALRHNPKFILASEQLRAGGVLPAVAETIVSGGIRRR